jgi:hypothetical protein
MWLIPPGIVGSKTAHPASRSDLRERLRLLHPIPDTANAVEQLPFVRSVELTATNEIATRTILLIF